MGHDKPAYEEYRKMTVEQLVEAMAQTAVGSTDYNYIRDVLVGRSALALHGGLMGNAEAVGKGANRVAGAVDALILAMGEAARELKTAGEQSSTAAKQMNRLTGWLAGATVVLAIATIIMAAGAGYQAYQAKRQADLTEQQIHQSSRTAQPAPADNSTPKGSSTN
jgi:preprotein translocase subunit SecG